jgi:hypothetical protein
MSTTHVTVLADGTKCYTGPTCKKHGAAAKKQANTVKAQQLQQKLNNLFENIHVDKNENEFPPVPKEWNKYQQENLKNKEEIFQRFGLKSGFVPTFHDNAMRYGYMAVPTGDKDTQLIVDLDGTYYKSGEKYYCRAWMYKEGKPVAMLRFATYPKNYVPAPNQYQHVESVVCDIEVNPEHRGNQYGIEIIRQVEKNILAGRLLHSGGSYTPEGRRSFGNVLPHTHEAKMEYKKDFAAGKIPESSFKSMNFVHNWDMLQPER